MKVKRISILKLKRLIINVRVRRFLLLNPYASRSVRALYTHQTFLFYYPSFKLKIKS